MSKTKESTKLSTQNESLDTTDNNNYSNMPLEIEALENTPFTLVRDKKEWFGVIGNHRITESFDDKESLIKEVQEITWDRLVQVIWAICKKFETIKKEE